jgi:large subunit ribosomal protein L18
MNYTDSRSRRISRTRATVTGTAARPRIAIQRTAKHLRAQLIDDTAGATMLSVGDIELSAKTNGTAQAEAVGTLLGQKATKAGISVAVLDRRGYRYHGRIKVFADALRAAGVQI